jgi:hypothetical protein
LRVTVLSCFDLWCIGEVAVAIVEQCWVNANGFRQRSQSNLKMVRVDFQAQTRSEVLLMKRLISLSLTVFSCLCLLLATERRAMAYVDPGSGLLAIQSIGSLLAAAGFFLRRRIMGLFNKKKPLASVASPVAVRKEDSRNTA